MTAVSTESPPARYELRDILGISVANIDWHEAIALLSRLVDERRFTKIAFLNANNANIACTNEAFRAAMQDYLVLSDGIGVDIAAKVLYGSIFIANLNGTDFIPALLKGIRTPLKVGLIGSRKPVVEAAAGVFAARAPQHRYIVVNDGFFGAGEEPEILYRLEKERPDILLVAMGVPRQELWITEKINGKHCTLPIAVGALFDLMSGTVPRAPMWMRRLRLEWLFRLLAEPRRLWRRYLVGNPIFMARVFRQKLTGGRS